MGEHQRPPLPAAWCTDYVDDSRPSCHRLEKDCGGQESLGISGSRSGDYSRRMTFSNAALIQERHVALKVRRAEARQHTVVASIFAIYALSLLEKPLRKWFAGVFDTTDFPAGPIRRNTVHLLLFGTVSLPGAR